MALQRTDIFGRKANTEEVREYILRKLTEHEITFEILEGFVLHFLAALA